MNLKVNLETLAGVSIYDAASDAIRISRLLDIIVHFSFNGIEIAVAKMSNVDDVVAAYNWAMVNKRDFAVAF